MSWHSGIPDVARENASEPNVCFYRAFPTHKIENYCELINDALTKKNIDYTVTKGIFLKYIGIRLTMALLRNIGGVDAAFSTEKSDEETIFEAGNFKEKYGMSKNKFKYISTAFQVCRYTDQQLREVSSLLIYITKSTILIFFSPRILGFRYEDFFKILTIIVKNISLQRNM
jgi:hypothetical protein